MYKLAARNDCSFKTVQFARWLPDSIVPFLPLKCAESPGEKIVPFSVLSTVHAKVANSNPTNYIFLRSTIKTLSIEHIKKMFPKYKNRAGLPTNSIAAEIIVDMHLPLSSVTNNISLNIHRHTVSLFSTQCNIP